MVTFVGTDTEADIIDADNSILGAFTGGTLAELQDLIGDKFEGLLFSDTIGAGGGNDSLYANSEADPDGSGVGDSLKGGGGDDFIRGSSGADTIEGGADDDSLVGGGGLDSVFGEAGNDTITIDDDTAIDAIDGGADDDSLDLDAWDTEAITVDLAAGTYSIAGFGSSTVVGVEHVKGGGGSNTLTGNTAANDLKGGGAADTISGGGGNDTLKGGGGADNLAGGTGSGDTVDYSNASTKVTVRLWNQTATGDEATGDTISGFEHAWGGSAGDAIVGSDNVGNFLDGNDGNDTMQGLSGNDTMKGGVGADNMNGGDGLDWLDYTDAAAKVTVRLWNSTATDDIATGDTIAGFEHVRGGDSGDAIVGADVVGNYLLGNGGNDTMQGLSGDDSMRGGAGADNLDGGTGTDMLDYSDATGKVTVRLWNSTATDDIATGDTIAGFENVYGGSAGDALVGADAQGNFLNGLGGNDTMQGLSGNDTLRGGAGADNLNGGADVDTLDYGDATGKVTVRLWNSTATDDIATGDIIAGFENVEGGTAGDAIVGSDAVANRLDGNGGNDTMQGLSGNDTMIGGAGADNLTGGTGNDTFEFETGFGADFIADFTAGLGATDVLRFVGLGAAFDSFAEIMAAATQVGADTVINLGGGNTITLDNVLKTNIVADDMSFG